MIGPVIRGDYSLAKVRTGRPVSSCSCFLHRLHRSPGIRGYILGQTKPENSFYSRVNVFGVFGAYSGDSSHILLGTAEQRKLLSFGVSYNRRFLLRRSFSWQYSAEILPVMLESNPLERFVTQQTSPTTATYAGVLQNSPVTCAPVTTNYSFVYNGVTYSGTETYSCYSQQWTMGEAMSPVGMQWNFLPTHRIQPFAIAHGGYMYSTRPIPTGGAGSFNFTFDIGAGVEFYRTSSQSIRLEYRYHHISNGDTANNNPTQLTYTFGR